MYTRIVIAALFLLANLGTNAQVEGYGNLEFVENKGQWDHQVMFKGELYNGAFFLQKQGFTVLLHNIEAIRQLKENHRYEKKDAAMLVNGRTLRSHAYRVSFVNANENVEIIPDKLLPSYNNYFIGNDPSKWASNCKIYQGITYKNVYPKIDLRYYTNNGQLKYDIIAHPGADISQIALHYEGADQMNVRSNHLIVRTSVGDVQELVPSAYQINASGRSEVRCRYQLGNDHVLRFKVGEYATESTLVIDPTLIFCSFTGSKASNWGFTATPGPDGSFYAGGIVFGNGFPTLPGSIEANFMGGVFDVGVMKFNSSGTQRVYATYLGGGDNETPHSMICDPQGELVVIGRTYSKDFPIKTTVGPGGGADMFVVKLNPAGTQLIGSMRIGGTHDDCVNIEDQFRTNHEVATSLIKNYGDDSRSEVILDNANNIFVAASTQSIDFPVTPGVCQGALKGKQDAVVLKINPACNNLLQSTFLGGSDNDAAFVLKINPMTQDVYVAGATASLDFPPIPKVGVVYQPNFVGGVSDGFVAILSNDFTQLKNSSYFGTPGFDAIYGIGFDKKGFPYIMGTTTGSWPVTGNVQFVNAGAKQYVSKLQPDLSGFVYSTTFGTASPMPNISPVAFLVDRCENVYVSGWGGWLFAETDPYGLSGTFLMPTTPDAIQKTTDGRDFYFIVIQRNAASLLYATFFGQKDGPKSISEHVDGGTSRYDQNGVIYQGICANCGDNSLSRFPTTPGVWSPNNGSGTEGCNLAAVKIAFNFAGVSADVRPFINGVIDSSGCAPLNVLFDDTIRDAKSYIWNFGDGSPDTTTTSYEVTHLYGAVGTYPVMVVAIDSNSCNVSDTVYLHIRARSDKANLDMNISKLPPCQSLQYQFSNNSTPPAGVPFDSTSFKWDFGDNTTQQAGPGPVTHTYSSPGTYTVKLYMVDTTYCNFPDSLVTTLRVAPLVKAQFATADAGCAPYLAAFNNTTLAGQQFYWNFGDGTTDSTDFSPSHLYSKPGTYTVKLVAIDSNTCNRIDTFDVKIRVSSGPQAVFSFGPTPPASNKPTIFYNSSVGASSFVWLFGDGDSVLKTNMDTVMHQYQKTATFQACLVALNAFGCPDTACQQVQTLINPLLDVPNAFTPGRFGQNSIIKVQGFGISSLTFRIYNRWGQLVFETNDPNQGWDGTFKGKPQPMDVYAYTLDAIFTDGKKTTKQGDITLIR